MALEFHPLGTNLREQHHHESIKKITIFNAQLSLFGAKKVEIKSTF